MFSPETVAGEKEVWWWRYLNCDILKQDGARNGSWWSARLEYMADMGGYDIHGRYGTCGQIFKVILSRGELEIISSSQLSFPHSRLPHCSAICSYHALGGFSILTPFLANNKKISGRWRFSVTAGCRLPWREESHPLPCFSGQIFLLVADHRKLSQKVSKQWLPQ